VTGLLLAAVTYGQNLQVNGTVLATRGPRNQVNRVSLVDMATGRITLVNANGYHCCFSHDGTRIAFTRYTYNPNARSILTMNNDGTGQRVLCQIRDPAIDDLLLSWTESEYIYWSEWNDTIYRASTVTGIREAFTTIHYLSKVEDQAHGTGLYGVVRLKTSHDGTAGSAISKGRGYVFALDLVGSRMLSEGPGLGCQGSISSSGATIAHGVTNNGPLEQAFPGTVFSTYYETLAFTQFSDRAITHFCWAPGQPAAGDEERVRDERWPVNTDDYVLCQGHSGTISSATFIYQVNGCSYAQIPGTVGDTVTESWDYWNGPLPSPPSTAVTERRSAAVSGARASTGRA